MREASLTGINVQLIYTLGACVPGTTTLNIFHNYHGPPCLDDHARGRGPLRLFSKSDTCCGTTKRALNSRAWSHPSGVRR